MVHNRISVYKTMDSHKLRFVLTKINPELFLRVASKCAKTIKRQKTCKIFSWNVRSFVYGAKIIQNRFSPLVACVMLIEHTEELYFHTEMTAKMQTGKTS